MNVFNANPYIRLTSHSSTLRPHSCINRRIIFDYELIVIKKGTFTLEYNYKNYVCKKGDILFIRPGVRHAFYMGESAVLQPHVHFDMEFLPNSNKVTVNFKDLEQLSEQEKSWIRQDDFYNYPYNPFIKIKDKQKFLAIFDDLVSGQKTDNYLWKKGCLIQLICIIERDNFQNTFSFTDDYPIELQLKDYIDAGLCYDLTLSQIANQFSYDKFYLERKFKAKFGQSVICYRNEKRLCYAQTLLKDYTVSQVAEKTGFTSIYSFSRAYKLKFGKSPSKDK